jgi:hypothetical protein
VSKAERNLEALNALRQKAGMLGEKLGGGAEELGQALLNVFGPKPTRDAVREQITSRQAATTPTLVGEQVRDAGGITMGQRRVPTVEDLGGAPKPEFDLNALDQNSPVVRRLQELRREIGPMQGPREATSADYIFQPAIRGMRNPAGMKATGTMFSSTGKVTEPGTRIGGRMMAGEFPNSPLRSVVRETEIEVSPDQLDLPLDFRSNREVMNEVERMLAPNIGGGVNKNTTGVITEFDPGALVRSPGGRLTSNDIARMKAEQDPMRPQGVQMADLNDIEFTMDPRQARNTGLAGAGALTVGMAEILRNRINNAAPEREAISAGEMQGPPDQSTNAGDYMGGDGSLPQGDGIVQPPVLTPEESAALDGFIEESTTAIQQSDPVSAQVVRAMAPKSPEQYANIGDYYADRAAFVRALQEGGGFQGVVDAIRSTASNADMANNLETFATTEGNRALAYENMLRQGLINREGQLINQQSESVTTPSFGSSLGTNNDANALGQANAAASQANIMNESNELQAAAEIQKNNEIIAASAPIEYENLQRPNQFLTEQLIQRLRGFA